MDLLAEVRKLKDAGIQEKDIAEALGFKHSVEFRRWLATTKLIEHKIKEANMIEPRKPWTGKFVCTKVYDGSALFTKGKIYNFYDQGISTDIGCIFPISTKISCANDLIAFINKMSSGDLCFIEYIE